MSQTHQTGETSLVAPASSHSVVPEEVSQNLSVATGNQLLQEELAEMEDDPEADVETGLPDMQSIEACPGSPTESYLLRKSVRCTLGAEAGHAAGQPMAQLLWPTAVKPRRAITPPKYPSALEDSDEDIGRRPNRLMPRSLPSTYCSYIDDNTNRRSSIGTQY